MKRSTVWSTSKGAARCAVLVLVALLYVLGAGPAPAQERKVGTVTGLAGEATVVHASLPRPAPLRFQDDIFFQDRVETQQESAVKILLGGKAILTVRELSSVTITEEPRRSIVDFRAGRLALQVIKNLFALGETAEVHTPNAVAAVRGSLLVVEMGGTPGAPEAHFTALEASVPIIVTPRSDPSRAVHLTPNQRVSISGTGRATRVSPVQRISPGDARQHARIVDMPVRPGSQPAQQSHPRAPRGSGQDHQGSHQDNERLGQGQGPSRGAGLSQDPAPGPGQSPRPGQALLGMEQDRPSQGQQGQLPWSPSGYGQADGPGTGDRRGPWQEPGDQDTGQSKTPRWQTKPTEGAAAFDRQPAPQFQAEERPDPPGRPQLSPQMPERFRPGNRHPVRKRR